MKIKVKGEQVLSGEITPSGSKNSAVAIIPATILFDKPVILENIPEITDVAKMVEMLRTLGSRIIWNKEKQSLEVDNSKLAFENLGPSEMGNMRGSSLFWGPMLARFGKIDFGNLPGGCTLGVRPISPHYNAFRSLGVLVRDSDRNVKMDASNAKAQEILLEEMSPTVTENAVMLATSLEGKTRIVGAASEPQVQDLCHFLCHCGAKIEGIGSNILEISGNKKLSPKRYKIFSDHYEITTFLAMTAVTGGEIKIHDSLPKIFAPIGNIFTKFGVKILYDGDTAILKKGQKIKITKDGGRGTLIVRAQPWPALPVDTLPLFIPLALAAKRGQVLFHNWMYEAGLFWTSELQKLGASIIMADPHRVIVNAGNKLYGAELEAPYIIRAVVAMVMAAMVAKGETTILNADVLYRGHPKFAQNLRSLGASIEEIA